MVSRFSGHGFTWATEQRLTGTVDSSRLTVTSSNRCLRFRIPRASSSIFRASLRLHAGVGSLDDLTADLDRAREVGAAIDAELAAAGEVAALLRA